MIPRLLFPLSGALAVGLPLVANADTLARHPIDQHDLARMSAPARSSFEDGEAALGGGDLARAAELFEVTLEGAPDSPIAARRRCQSLTALGRHADAILACQKATSNGGSPMDLLAAVGALVSGPTPPTPEELGTALDFAKKATELMPSQPWGYAADCEIASRLGDRIMLEKCVRKLERVAPGHEETRRFRALMVASRHPLGRSLGWAAIGAACLASLVRAGRGLWARAAGRAIAGGVLALAALASQTSVARAAEGEPVDLSRRWSVNDQDPEKSVPDLKEANSDPLQAGYFLMDLTIRAQQAMQRQDYASAVKFYRAMVKTVPKSAVPYSKLCEAYEALGERDRAVDSCRWALGRPGVTVADYTRFVGLFVGRPGELSKQDVVDLDAIVAHLKAEEQSGVAAFEVACTIGVRLQDVKRLEECTAGLRSKAPDAAQTVAFEWALALRRGDYREAERLVDRAQGVGMMPERVSKMREATVKALPIWRRALADWKRSGAAALLLGVAALGGILLVRRTRVPLA
jgi:tetratricopeptide (TPR) repeat protein